MGHLRCSLPLPIKMALARDWMYRCERVEPIFECELDTEGSLMKVVLPTGRWLLDGLGKTCEPVGG